MTQYDKLKSLFDEFELEYTEESGMITDFWKSHAVEEMGYNGEVKQILIQEGNNKVGGYCSFYSIYVFTAEGKFLRVQLLE